MPDNAIFDGDPDDTHTALMKATYLALCKYGYADLTIQRIGDEFGKSKSLLYHHYDGKDELLVSFLEYMLEDFKADMPEEDSDDAEERLRRFLDHILSPTLDDERDGFTSAMIELRAQAPHDDAYREQFTRADQFFRQQIADIIHDGVEQGVFREVDPERTAALLHTTINGSMLQQVTTDDPDDTSQEIRDELAAYIDARLLTTDGD